MSRVQTITLGANANPAIQQLGSLQAALQPLSQSANQFAKALSDFNKQANASNQSLNNLSNSFKNATQNIRGFGLSIIDAGINKLTNDVKVAIGTTIDFTKQIALIQTITQDAGLSTEEWASRLTRLSNEFGVPQVEVAKAAYEALQNQVADASNVTGFLSDAFRLARVTGSDVTSAVNVLSSTINAFGLSARDAERVSAQLFEAVDRGRFRIQDLESQFGRTAVTANQLGVSLPELTAALATLTRQGISLDTAQTQVLNIFNKLLQAGPELRRALQDIAKVSTGRELIERDGLVGVFQLFNRVLEENPERLADVLPEIRALQGALGLTGKSLADFIKDLEAVEQSGNKFAKAVDITANSLGQRLQVQLQQLRNFDQELFGPRALKAITDLLDAFISLINSTGEFRNLVVATANTFSEFFRVLSGTSQELSFLGAGAKLARDFFSGLNIIIREVSEATGVFSGIIGQIDIQRALSQAERFGKELRFQEENRAEEQRKINESLERSFDDSLKKQLRSYITFAAGVKSESLELKNQLVKDLETINARIELLSKGVADRIKRNISELEAFAKQAQKAVEDSIGRVRDIQQGIATRAFETQLGRAAPGRQFDILIGKVDELIGRSSGLLRFNDALTKTFGISSEQQIKASTEAFDEALKVLDRAAEQRRRLGDVASRIIPEQRLVAGPRGLEEPTGLARVPQFENIQEVLRAARSINDLALARRIIEEERIKLEQAHQKTQEQAAKNALTAAEQQRQRLREFLELSKQVAEFSLFDKAGKLKFPSVEAGLEELRRLQLEVVEKAGGDLDKAFAGLELGKRFQEQIQRVQEIEQIDRITNTINTKQKELETVLGNLVKTFADTNKNVSDARSKINEGLIRLSENFRAREELARTPAGVAAIGREGAAAITELSPQLISIFERLRQPDASIEEFRRAQTAFNSTLDVFGKIFNQDFTLGKQQFAELVRIREGIQGQIEQQRALTEILRSSIIQQASAFAQTIGAAAGGGGGIPGLAVAGGVLAQTQTAFNDIITKITQSTSLQNTLLQQQAQVSQGIINALNTQVTELQGVNARLTAARSLAAEVGQAIGLAAARPFQHGGLVTGPKGNDKILARLTHGEFVMPPGPTKKFYTELMAMRAGHKPPGFATGGLVTNNNIGDINVIVRGGDTKEKTLRNVAQGLRRDIRRGIIKLN